MVIPLIFPDVFWRFPQSYQTESLKFPRNTPKGGLLIPGPWSNDAPSHHCVLSRLLQPDVSVSGASQGLPSPCRWNHSVCQGWFINLLPRKLTTLEPTKMEVVWFRWFFFFNWVILKIHGKNFRGVYQRKFQGPPTVGPLFPYHSIWMPWSIMGLMWEAYGVHTIGCPWRNP